MRDGSESHMSPLIASLSQDSSSKDCGFAAHGISAFSVQPQYSRLQIDIDQDSSDVDMGIIPYKLQRDGSRYFNI